MLSLKRKVAKFSEAAWLVSEKRWVIMNGRLVAIIRRDWRLSLDRLGEICDKARKIDGLVRKMGTMVNMEKTALK